MRNIRSKFSTFILSLWVKFCQEFIRNCYSYKAKKYCLLRKQVETVKKLKSKVENYAGKTKYFFQRLFLRPEKIQLY